MIMWRKPDNLKYTDLCIYIDAHSAEIVDADPEDEVPNLIYNYIYLLVKALAIKKRMFDNFSDYDGYALQSANRLFFALKKSYMNEGKVIKGKTIKPIKSILNYTKALLYPMKLEYLNSQYNIKTRASEAAKEFNKFTYRQNLRDQVWESQRNTEKFKESVIELFYEFNKTLESVLKKSPFRNDSPEYKKIKISILLNCLQNLKEKNGINADPVTVKIWKLPKSMNNYIRVFITELGTSLKHQIINFYSELQIEDKILDYLISNPSGEYNDNEDKY